MPNDYTIVRGGTTPMPPKGDIVSGAQGLDVNEAASYVPHGKIRTTTAGAIRMEGGTVQVVPQAVEQGGQVLNYLHVDFIEGEVSTFSEMMQNPINPGKVRMTGPGIMNPTKKP